MKKQVEEVIMEYEMQGIPRLRAIRRAISDGKLRRKEDGTLVKRKKERKLLGV